MKTRFFTLCAVSAALCLSAAGVGFAQNAQDLKVGPEGQVSVPVFDFPVSNLASPEMNASFRARVVEKLHAHAHAHAHVSPIETSSNCTSVRLSAPY